jgi:hypothetical protein
MYRDNDFIYEAIASLESIINVPIDVETFIGKYDAVLSIENIDFIVEAKSVMRTSNHGLVLSHLEDLRNATKKPIIFIAEYISKGGAALLKKRGFNYIDAAGNASINHRDLIIYIKGQKRKSRNKKNQTRAFQEAGLKIIFHLLSSLNNLQDSYRQIAEKNEVSLGSVSNVMAELIELNYLIKSNNERILRNKKELLERWSVEFNTGLKPRIVRNKMKFIDRDNAHKWRNIDLKEFQGSIVWGGEPAGAILTEKLKPEEYIIYSNLELPVISKILRLVPDKTGNVEIRRKFWNDNSHIQNIAPALLIYTDLINSGYGRNVEIANQIFENELQHIQ